MTLTSEELRVQLFDMLRSSGMSGNEFMAVLLQVVCDISCGYMLACDKSERFQMHNAIKKGFEDVMKQVNK